MSIVLLDEPGLFVFESAAAAVRDIEPPDAESDIRAVFDDGAVPYRVEWLRPNRYSTVLGALKSVELGEYRFVPAGHADPAALIELLENYADYTHPQQAKVALEALLEKMRGSDSDPVLPPHV
jgi:hypothetical protein